MNYARSLFFAAALTTMAATAVPVADMKSLQVARNLVETGDYLGFRAFLRKLVSRPMTVGEWYELRKLIHATPNAGYDLIYAWDKRRPKEENSALKISEVDRIIQRADELMVAKDFDRAFELYQQALLAMKRDRKALEAARSSKAAADSLANNKVLYPFVLNSLGRAAYGAKRFPDATLIYSWITPGYPRFRQAMFEKMWSAFRAGKMDTALGAIASQRSSYFSSFLEPETYLIQAYIYKKLCREEDLRYLLLEIRDFQNQLKSGAYGVEQWAMTDIESRALYNLLSPDMLNSQAPLSRDDRELEQDRIRNRLSENYKAEKGRLIEDLSLVLAYSQLATTSVGNQGLEPIEKLPSRQKLFESGLEIWPADSAEDWIDELGYHRFIGDSLCAAES